jgi:Protein of unknown function (DUF2281)
MTSEEVLLEKIKVLPPNLKQEAIHFVEFLESKITFPNKRKSLKGSLSHLNIKISDADIREARNEMWRGYTKDTENES